jgi:TonB family protein
MKKFHSIVVVILLAVCSVSLFAQTKNPKVIKHFAPKYPAAAQAVRATGTIDVSVKIGKDGKVTSATALNGHPLLRKACENAAKEWTFTSDSNSDEHEVKITFLLRLGDKNEKDKVKFKKPYTLELIGVLVKIVDTASY